MPPEPCRELHVMSAPRRVALLLALTVAWTPAMSQGLGGKPRPGGEAPQGPETQGLDLPGDEGRSEPTGSSSALSVSADHQEQTGTSTWVFEGNVRILYKDMEVHADRVEVDKDRGSVAAEGNVLVISGKLRMSGERAELDLESRTGSVHNGHAFIDPSFQIRGERIDKVADDRFVLTEGEITACDQAIPQWSLKTSSARLRLEGYARIRNARFNVKKVPIFYTPYLIWPVKRDRATGFLIPHLGSSKSRGTLISEAFFLVLGRSADATFYGDYYTEAGFGPGLQLRYAPSEGSKGQIYGFYLDDKRTDADASWRITAAHQQKLGERFRLVVDANVVSDDTYYEDFERNFSSFSSRASRWVAYLSGGFAEYSFNARAEDSDEFRTRTVYDPVEEEYELQTDTLSTSRLPEVSITKRESKLFGPLYFGFSASGALLERHVELTQYDAEYSRVDAFPKFSLDLPSPPWLTVTPTLAARYTRWSQRTTVVQVDPNDPLKGTRTVLLDEPITRTYGEAGLEIVGPSFSRLWESGPDEDGKTHKKKHLIEPQVSYRYISSIDDVDVIPVADSGDFVLPLNEVAYGIVSRYLVKRPVDEDPDPLRPPLQYHYIYDTTCSCYQKRPTDGTDSVSSISEQVFEAESDIDEQVFELWNFSVGQRYSLDSELATDYGRRTTYTGGFYVPPEARERFSPIVFQFNYFPNRYSSISASADYDAQGSALIRALLTATLRDRKGRWFELSYAENADVEERQVRSSIGLSLAENRWRFELDQTYDLQNRLGDTGLRYARALANWNGQCFGVIAEYSAYNYTGFDDYELRFAFVLPHVGTFLDLRRGSSGLFQGGTFGGTRGAPF